MSKSIVVEKTDFTLPVIQILNSDIQIIHKELVQLQSNEGENYSIPCVLSITECFEPTFLARLLDILRQFNLIAIGLKTEDKILSEQADFAGLAVFNNNMNQADLFGVSKSLSVQNSSNTENMSSGDKSPKIHQGNVRFGEQVYAEGCDLIVLGDIEHGAEVIADGSIYIGGSLNGRAYAGNSGTMNMDAICVQAYVFEPELISIVGFYQLKNDISDHYLGLNIEARFNHNKLEYSLKE
ncbi:septum site-determining protein MinC [Thiomicrorhabdus hydrogeniphila]